MVYDYPGYQCPKFLLPANQGSETPQPSPEPENEEDAGEDEEDEQGVGGRGEAPLPHQHFSFVEGVSVDEELDTDGIVPFGGGRRRNGVYEVEEMETEDDNDLTWSDVEGYLTDDA